MYIGMDTHKRYSQIAIMEQDGHLVDERRLEHVSDFAELEAFALEFAGSQVAIEATGHYRPIYETLDDYMDVTLVNPSKTPAVAETKIKNDRLDANLLAHLHRMNLLAESYVPPKEIRQQRDLVRRREPSSKTAPGDKPGVSSPCSDRQRLQSRAVRTDRQDVPREPLT